MLRHERHGPHHQWPARGVYPGAAGAL